MQTRFLIAAALLCAAPAAVADSVSGSCRYKGKELAARDGAVFRQVNAFDEAKQDMVVAITSIALDKAAIAKAQDKEREVRDQIYNADDAAQVALTIDGNEVTALQYQSSGMSLSRGGNGIGTLSTKASDAKHVDARFVLDGDGKDDLACDLSFNLSQGSLAAASAAARDAAPGKTAAAGGKPLPAGGGEPGKVFQANLAAMQKGDVKGMLATMSKAQAEQMRAQQKDPKFSAMLEMMKAFAPKSATVTGGTEFAGKAELSIDAVDQSGGTSRGTSVLVKEDGQWKVQKTSMKSGG